MSTSVEGHLLLKAVGPCGRAAMHLRHVAMLSKHVAMHRQQELYTVCSMEEHVQYSEHVLQLLPQLGSAQAMHDCSSERCCQHDWISGPVCWVDGKSALGQ